MNEHDRSAPAANAVLNADLDDERSYRLFSLLFALSILLLFAERNAAHQVVGTTLPMPIELPVLLALVIAWKPSSVVALLGFWVSYAYFLYAGFPYNNTNQTLTFFVGLAILGAALRCMLRARSFRITGAVLFREFAPLVQLCVVSLYAWTIWHKLNFDFINPELTCTRRLSTNIFDFLGVASAPDTLAPFAIVATLLAEATLPLGLLFRRTQVPTALFGIAFHWVLGLAGFYGFSATMIALLTLFLAPAAGRYLCARQDPKLWRLNRLVLAGFVSLVFGGKLLFGFNAASLTKHLWLLLPVGVTALVWLNRGTRSALAGALTIRRAISSRSPLLLVPALTFLNGASPYLGGKTEYSYAMYSNLRTEGGHTNHLLWRVPLAIWGYQTDLVRVLPGSDSALLSTLGGRPVTRYEVTSSLWKLVSEQRRHGIRLVLDANGHTRTYESADAEPELLRKPSYLQRKLLRFRDIVPPSKASCAH